MVICKQIESQLEEPMVVNGYSLPLKNVPIEVSQGYNGDYSHFAYTKNFHINNKAYSTFYDDRYSLDFKVPLNTRVYAAKKGVVIGFIDDSNFCYRGLDFSKGINCTPNFVLLEHSDRTFSVYSHLKKGSVVPKFGELVLKGEEIARTGLSGWIGLFPHLHFEAFRINGRDRLSFPTIFDDYPYEAYT